MPFVVKYITQCYRLLLIFERTLVWSWGSLPTHTYQIQFKTVTGSNLSSGASSSIRDSSKNWDCSLMWVEEKKIVHVDQNFR